ncbi:DUF4376 domain-containing protein [Paraburkholderia phosphatilytica]|uniref:DUF4376 domain-containing protein n=1 Tax=Paraburkholderia phosphatilytica TaxID=2282883 RepID=UPI0013DF9615|nr:DUF4376 domain-containing protein [Paraburkholderia phosphatilytica]
MTTIFVQFADATETVVVATFGCSQDANEYPNQGEIDATDLRYLAFSNPSATVPGAKAAQIAALNSAYQAAITAPVSYTTAAGTTATFNQDATAKSNLQNAMLASEKAGTWPLNLWLSAGGEAVTPFTYADLQGLAAAMEAVDAPDYTQLLSLVAQVNAATTVAAVQAVVWPQ